VYEPLRMQWMGICNHRQPVTIALVDPDFDSRLKAWVSAGLQTIPLPYAVVEAPYPSKAACTSMWSTYKVYVSLHMQWMGIWNHRLPFTIALVDPDFDSRLKAWVTLLGYKPHHYRMQWLRLHTHPKLFVSIWSTYKVYEPLHMQWMGIWTRLLANFHKPEERLWW
jgi:hypothetical protein